MSRIGPYVTAQVLTSGVQGDGAVTVFRAVDRLTGMPALVYRLPVAMTAPVPAHGALLPLTERGHDGQADYVACELPPHATPPADLLEAARGGLAALAALHATGALHGGVTPSQLWRVDDEVLLAGAGLPWGRLGAPFDAPEGGKSPAADLYALGRTLETLGPLPSTLAGLVHPDPALRPAAALLLSALSGEPDQPGPPASPAEAWPPVTELPEAAFIPASDADPHPEPAPDGSPAPVNHLSGLPAESPDTLKSGLSRQTTEQWQGEPSPLNVGTIVPRAAFLPPEPVSAPAQEPEPETPPTVTDSGPAPLQIGFDMDDLPDWSPEPEAPGRSPAFSQTGPETPHPVPAAATPVIRETPVSGRTIQPIRIGWEEDHSWRVVREPKVSPGIYRRRRRVPGWLWTVPLLLVIPAGTYVASLSPQSPAAGTCCEVEFRVQGSTDPVTLKILSVPDGSSLKAGETLGVVPGHLRFPDLPGTYRLQATAEHYAPIEFPLTLPSARPVTIDVTP